MIKTCADCDNSGWVCEDHPEVPWNSGEGCCGGAGALGHHVNVILKAAQIGL